MYLTLSISSQGTTSRRKFLPGAMPARKRYSCDVETGALGFGPYPVIDFLSDFEQVFPLTCKKGS